MPKLSDLAERQSWMDKNGIDHQVIGGWLDSFGYELPAAQGAAWSRFLNDCMWEQFRDERRFSPLATVPLQDGKLAAFQHPKFWQCMDTLREKRTLESLWATGKAPWKVWE